MNNPLGMVDPDGKEVIITIKNENGTRYVHIQVTATLIDLTGNAGLNKPSSLTNEQQEKMGGYADRIMESFNELFSFEDKDAKTVITANLQLTVASSVDDIKSTDHVLAIREGLGAHGSAEPGQRFIEVSSKILDNARDKENKSGKTKDGKASLERTAVHELGHSMGLVRHPGERYTMPKNIDPKGNLMTSTVKKIAGLNLVIPQINHIINQYEGGKLNGRKQLPWH
ncbi:MAG: hypothetical protein JNN12_12310 [Bacteroidetes Order II. Incertae sedis bacterium]|nr:hypothetical protein [Bacteroidetes Order II. bacterium]